MLSWRVPCPAVSAARDGGMTPAATAVQGRVRWGALGYRISRVTSEEEEETRQETGAAGVKAVQLDVFIAHVHRYETTARLLVPYRAITVLKGLPIYKADGACGGAIAAERGAPEGVKGSDYGWSTMAIEAAASN
jgi:hypothetical protein